MFAVAVLEGPFAGTEVGDKLVEDLAEVVNALAPEPDGGDESIRAAMARGLETLVEACLKPRSSLNAGPEEASWADVSIPQHNAIRGLRSVLLRTRNGEIIPPPTRFPHWVQALLLDLALEAVSADVGANTLGKRVRAKRLSVMLAANFAAFRSRQHKVRFINLLEQLCPASEEYMDPFLRDLVQIAHVAELGAVQ